MLTPTSNKTSYREGVFVVDNDEREVLFTIVPAPVDTYIEMQVVRIITMLRKRTIAHCEPELKKILGEIKEHYYSDGLAHMDLMHGTIDNTLADLMHG